MSRRTALALALSLLSAPSVRSQAICERFDAALGTTPDQQGWALNQDPPASTSYGLSGGTLVQSTLPFTNPTCAGGADPSSFLNWVSTETPFDFDDGFVLSAELRVVASQYLANPCNGWPRAGLLLASRDAQSRAFHVGLGEGTVYLTSDPYQPFGSATIVEVPFDTTDGFHSYRLEVDSIGGELFIDDVSVAVLSHGTPFGTPNSVVFGDGTTWSNSEVIWRSFSALGGPSGPGWTDLGHGLAGSRGMPCLTAQGSLAAGDTATFRLDNALQGTTAWWVWGLQAIDAPFKGGVLVPDPAPPGFLIGTGTGPTGTYEAAVPIPAGLPPGVDLFWQWWILDPAGSAGFAASNGLMGTTP